MKWLPHSLVNIWSRITCGIYACPVPLQKCKNLNNMVAYEYAAQGNCWYGKLNPWNGFTAWKRTA